MNVGNTVMIIQDNGIMTRIYFDDDTVARYKNIKCDGINNLKWPQ